MKRSILLSSKIYSKSQQTKLLKPTLSKWSMIFCLSSSFQSHSHLATDFWNVSVDWRRLMRDTSCSQTTSQTFRLWTVDYRRNCPVAWLRAVFTLRLVCVGLSKGRPNLCGTLSWQRTRATNCKISTKCQETCSNLSKAWRGRNLKPYTPSSALIDLTIRLQ